MIATENEAIRDLNMLLKGEQMAVESYEKYISSAEDPKIRYELRTIQEEHKEHVELLAERIRKLGGRADPNTGMGGVLANAKLTLSTKGGLSSVELLKRVYDGEDKGIAAAEGIRKDLDEESKNLVNEILSQDHRHLKSMLSLITEYGYLH